MISSGKRKVSIITKAVSYTAPVILFHAIDCRTYVGPRTLGKDIFVDDSKDAIGSRRIRVARRIWVGGKGRVGGRDRIGACG